MVASTERRPVVVVRDLHVKYSVLATGKKATSKNTAKSSFRRRRETKTVHALKGISFTAHENDSIGVIGSNGSGKSTLMRAITGLTPPTSGEIWASSRPSLLGVGAALIKDLSGRNNVILGGLALGFTKAEVEEKFDEIVDFADIRDFIDMPMRTYSSGMTQRLKFAIASVRNHEILIIDEALSVGDKDFRKRSEKRLREIRDNAGTVFLVSHSMRSIRRTCNRVLWVEKGVLMMDGDPDEVIDAYESSR